MAFTLRPLNSTDYESLAQFYGRAGQPASAESLRYSDEARESYCRSGRYLAEADGAIVGTARYRQNAGAYHPRKFDVKVLVLPDYRGRGIGTALYDVLMQTLQPYDPIALGATVSESDAAGRRFAEKRGFVEDMRQWEYRLDLSAPETSEYESALARASAAGYEVTTFAELAGDPEQNRRMYELMNEVRRDVPTTEAMTDIPWERWARSPASPNFWPEGFFIARRGDELVGLSQLWRSDQPGLAQTGLTAVRRAHRGRGVAQALKVHAVRTARAAGYSTVSTWNATTNRGMMAINEKLGFVRQPASIHLSLLIRPE